MYMLLLPSPLVRTLRSDTVTADNVSVTYLGRARSSARPGVTVV